MTDTQYTIKGKPLAECSVEELNTEYDAGNWFECQEGLAPEQERRLIAIETEIERRHVLSAGKRE